MHLLVRESRSLDEAEAAYDPGPSDAPLLFLSFSDSDLGTWRQAAGHLPGIATRFESLSRLRHPMSVDLLIEQVVAPARCVVIRLLGGLDYWRYGVEEVAAHCRTHGIALLLLPGCERRDPRLAEWSTVSPAHWNAWTASCARAVPATPVTRWRSPPHLGGLDADDGAMPEELPEAGEFELPGPRPAGAPLAVILF